MRRPVLLLLTLAVVAAACSGTAADTTTTGTVATTTTVTTTTAVPTTTTPPFITAYPDLEYELEPIADDERHWVPSPRTLELDAGPTLDIAYRQGYFEPAIVELVAPELIRFTNTTDEPVTIAFAKAEFDEFTIDPGDSKTVNVAALPPDVYRYHTYVGASKIPGTIDSRALGEFVGAPGEPTPQWSFSGRLNVVLEERLSRWDVYPQHEGVVAVPRTSTLNESFLRSLVLGDPLTESGLSIQLVDDTGIDRLLETISAPSGCEPGAAEPTTRADLSGTEQTYTCEVGEIRFGALEADATTLVYALAEVPAGSAPDLEAILESARVEPAGSGTPRFGADSAGPFPYRTLGDLGTWPIAIVDATLGPWPTIGVLVGNATEVRIANHDDVTHVVSSVAGPILELPPLTAVTLALRDVAGDAASAHFTLGESVFGRMSVDFDLSGLKPLPPRSVYADPTMPATEVIQREFEYTVDEILVLQTLDVPSWRTDDEWLLARRADPEDVTELNQYVDVYGLYTTSSYEATIAVMAVDMHSVPTEVDTFRYPSAAEWRVAYWDFDDHPSTAVAHLVADDQVLATITLTTAPEEFDLFVEELFWPALRAFAVTVED